MSGWNSSSHFYFVVHSFIYSFKTFIHTILINETHILNIAWPCSFTVTTDQLRARSKLAKRHNKGSMNDWTWAYQSYRVSHSTENHPRQTRMRMYMPHVHAHAHARHTQTSGDKCRRTSHAMCGAKRGFAPLLSHAQPTDGTASFAISLDPSYNNTTKNNNDENDNTKQ